MTDTKRDPLFSETNLIWIDLEMTGLQPEVNRIIELGAIITDAQLNDSRGTGDRDPSGQVNPRRDG